MSARLRSILTAIAFVAIAVGLVVSSLPSRDVPKNPTTPAELMAEATRLGVEVDDLLTRCRRVLRFWLPRADAKTGLVPNFLPGYSLMAPKGVNARGPHYSAEDSGADNYPFQVIAAWLTDADAFAQAMPAMLAAEQAHATVVDGIPPEWVDLTSGELGPLSLFGGAEYAKDGLLSITGLLGRTPWYARMRELAVAIMQHAATPSRFGMLPGDGAEINGDMLLVLVPLAWMGDDPRFAAWADRIAQAYVDEVLPGNHGLPAQRWDFERHRGDGMTHLRDHGNEIIAGLVLHHLYLSEADPPRAARERPRIQAMLDHVLASANDDGLLHNRIDSATRAPRPGDGRGARLADSWGYVYGAVYNWYLLTGDVRYRDSTLAVMRHVPEYREATWITIPGHDDLADSIESAIYLLAHEDVPEAWQWVHAMVARLVAMQQPDGSIGQSYLDGNWLRTVMMYLLSLTRGVTVDAWRPGVRLGAVERDGTLYLSIAAGDGAPWSGRLRFDVARHASIFRMRTDYVRLNAWPEWFVVDPAARYRVTHGDGATESPTGAELARGLAVQAPDTLVVTRLP